MRYGECRCFPARCARSRHSRTQVPCARRFSIKGNCPKIRRIDVAWLVNLYWSRYLDTVMRVLMENTCDYNCDILVKWQIHLVNIL